MQLTKAVIGPELDRFETYYHDFLQSRVPLMDRVMQYLADRRGKQLRPMFVLLCARLGGAATERSYRAALLVELLHTASLVHDDLVDDSMKRRGAYSVNALWNNKMAVLMGDQLFSGGLVMSLENEDYRILKIYSSAIRQMVESELLQIVKSNKISWQEDAYYETIQAKTASFLAAACAAGAASVFTDEDSIQRLHSFGEKVGMAFQIKDDLFDYGSADVGKPTGNDIKEKKITLPLIYTLNNCTAPLRKKLLHAIKYEHTDKETIAWIIEEVIKTGGIGYAEEKMAVFRHEAMQLLYSFPASPVRDALEELVVFTTDRNK